MTTLASYLPGIAMAYGLFALGMFSPGPNILSIIATSMGVGRRQGRALALGIASGSLVWAVLAWSGLSALLSVYASVLVGLKVAGAAYLLWLAVKAFRSAARPTGMVVRALEAGRGPWAYWRRGILIQMTNPKAALSWIAIMALGVDAQAPLWVGGTIVVGTTLLSLLGHLAYAVAFSTAPVVSRYRRARRWIEAALGAFYCFAGYKLLTSRV